MNTTLPSISRTSSLHTALRGLTQFGLIALAIVFSLLAQGARADGLVPNAGFEEGAGGIASSWQVDRAPLTETPSKGKGGAVVEWSASSRGDGKRCVRMHGDAPAGSDYAIVVSSPIKVVPGFQYTAAVFYKAIGMLPENGDRTLSVHAIMDVFQHDKAGKRVGNARAITFSDTAAWSRLETQPFTAPADADTVQIRLQLSSSVAGRPYDVSFDDASLTPTDASVPNAGFETLDASGLPTAWRFAGAAKSAVDDAVHHGGKYSVSVTDAGLGPLAGWSVVVPARTDRQYRFVGWAKGGSLAANSALPGGALQIEFLDSAERVLGKPVLSPCVGPNEDWKLLETPSVQPPPGTVEMRLTAGLQFCNGTAWFDDMRLDTAKAAAASGAEVKIVRTPTPDPSVKYGTNLLANADLEVGNGEKPANWTFVGSSARDWTDAAIATLHREGRPQFSVGRAQGEWNHDNAYSGRGALLLESIDPPLSTIKQWYGRNPVDGYWLSDPMPCAPNAAYMASGWVLPGATIAESWYGPLELRFYNAAGRQVQSVEPRTGMGDILAGEWSWWTTRPYVAPVGAATMRLRVGQELNAASGGWGRSIYDNLTVWKVDASITPPAASGDSTLHRSWLRKLFASTPPPYQPSPASAAAYESSVARLDNVVVGNCFRDPSAPVALRASVTNLLGEARSVDVTAQCMDWKGAATAPVTVKGVKLNGFGETAFPITLPATHAFGSYYVELTVKEGAATVGSGSGRFGELPPLTRPRTHQPIWGVTPLMQLAGDNNPDEKALGEMLKTAGFGITWIRLHPSSIDPATIGDETAKLRPLMKWYLSLGIHPVLQLHFPARFRPVLRDEYVAAGRAIAKNSADLVIAYGNHGIEQANSTSPFRGGGAARMTDDEYDTILSGYYEGLKAEAPQIPVLVGNIATDWEGKTLNRLYGPPGKGAFDGAILNAYLGVTMTILNNIKVFDAHGDKTKTIWQEETASQRSPITGDARRYGEGDGAANLVRAWLEPAIKAGDRLKAFTMWGFRARGSSNEDDIAMVNADLQPRPQFVAHAVMADTLADATLVADRSVGALTCGEWKRGDGTLLVMWSNGGAQGVALEAPKGSLTVMDLMGNRRTIKATDRVAVLNVGSEPVYCFSGGALTFSKRIEVSLVNGSMVAGAPVAALHIRNNQAAPTNLKIAFRGPVSGQIPSQVMVPAHGDKVVDVTVDATTLDPGKRTPISAMATMATGAMFGASASLNYAYAVHASPLPFTGKWDGAWQKAVALPFGRNADEIVKPSVPNETYDGVQDVLGNVRLLWDDKNLYLGVEALDDVFCPVPGRGRSGFMGDSVEFAIQPDAKLSNLAPRFEYEFYLPAGDTVPVVNRRFPSNRAEETIAWPVSVTPTGHRGDVNYQLAIPWSELGITAPVPGKVFTLGVVLNDADKNPTSGGRGRILWFRGVDTKNTEGFGDVVLVEAH